MGPVARAASGRRERCDDRCTTNTIRSPNVYTLGFVTISTESAYNPVDNCAGGGKSICMTNSCENVQKMTAVALLCGLWLVALPALATGAYQSAPQCSVYSRLRLRGW